MKTTYYLLKHEGLLSIYMVSELKTPPVMDVGVLDTYIMGQHKEVILGFGCSQLHVFMKPETHVFSVDKEGVETLDTYEVSDTPVPDWLEKHNCRDHKEIDRCLLIGDPTVYTHLVPIENADNNFVSVDPTIKVVMQEWDDEFPEKERILVVGGFDLFHAGHTHFLNEVWREYGNEKRELHVGTPDDNDLAILKGRAPVFSFSEREAILKSHQHVTAVHYYKIWQDVPIGNHFIEDGHRKLLETVKPALFVDSAQKPKERIGIIPYLGKIPIYYVDSIPIHTTEILKRIQP